ncbi:MAG: M6 family metalloprotease domain-containing protein [Muribaculaceae bacterium]|nr:M6 family metalloprotease domain-containing protein [Muribaculaceae bacterium]
MKKFNLITYALITTSIFSALPSLGVPANPALQPVTQPDGSVVMARLHGDERSHLILSADGLPIDRGSDGLFYYYECGADERPVLSKQRVADPKETLKEKAFIESIDRQKLEKAFNKDRELKVNKRVRSKVPPQVNAFPCTGSPRGLVLLIEYSDVSFTVPNPNDSFARMLNEEGYSDYGGWGSARDWFISNSDGRFTPQFDVVGPITLSHPRAYYGANKGGDDIRPEMMIIEACGMIADEVDFSLYDADDDGFIDNVFAFYAGYGENLGAMVPSECVWPHSWDIAEATSVPYYFNGKRLNHYACTNEIDLTNTMDGIGTFVHEFSHVMGLPDLYATNYSFAFTPGRWSVMDEGPYNNNSRTPPCYSAFERLSLGWLEPVKLDKPSNIKIPPIAENRAYYIPTEDENEYFLLENRQQTGWDTFIPYHGMLVWHIDYNENIWRYNTVNDRRDHQYVDIVEADNHQNEDTVDGDPFPGAKNITSFTDETEPAMVSWAGAGCGVPLTDIYESNGYIYLKACGGKSVIEPTVALEATEVESDSFTANWEASSEEGCHYLLSVYTSSLRESGQPVISYVAGYEDLDVGSGVTSAPVGGLNPGEEYRYSVRVLDPETNLRSIPSNEITVKLLPPTFDCLTPRASGAEDITHDAFTACWEPLDGAEGYTISLVNKVMGEPSAATCGFDNGLSDLPEGWSTNSRLTYAAEDYCGESAPSLRFNSEGHYLELTAPEGYVRGLRMWLRRVGSSDETRIEVKAHVAGEWISALDLNPEDYLPTRIAEIDEEELPFGADALRLIFHPGEKGSLAIDDVALLWGGATEVIPHPVFTNFDAGNVCSLRLEGLESNTPYFFTVTARQGELVSKISNEVRVVTLKESGIEKVYMIKANVSYNRANSTVTVNGATPNELVRIVTCDGYELLSGRCDDEGNAIFLLPEYRGVALLTTSTYTTKIIM